MKAAALDQHRRNPCMSSCSAFEFQWHMSAVEEVHDESGAQLDEGAPDTSQTWFSMDAVCNSNELTWILHTSSRGFNVLVSRRVWKEIKRPTWFLTTETDWNCFSVIPVGLQNKTATLCLLFVPLNDLIHHRKKHTHNWQQSHFRVSVGKLMLSSSNSLLLDWCFVLYILL